MDAAVYDAQSSGDSIHAGAVVAVITSDILIHERLGKRTMMGAASFLPES